ncbi:ATP-dependent RNA helicase DEAH13 [Orobanche hederae]
MLGKSDFLLKRYSVIILEEVHERNLNTDILVGMLSRVIQQRQMNRRGFFLGKLLNV